MAQMVRFKILTSLLMLILVRTAVNYLLKFRLQWGKPDTKSLLRSSLDELALIDHQDPHVTADDAAPETASAEYKLPAIPADHPNYFTADISPELISIILNDWPYSGTYIASYRSVDKPKASLKSLLKSNTL